MLHQAIAEGDYSARAAGYVLEGAAALTLNDDARETFADMSEALIAQLEVVGNSAKVRIALLLLWALHPSFRKKKSQHFSYLLLFDLLPFVAFAPSFAGASYTNSCFFFFFAPSLFSSPSFPSFLPHLQMLTCGGLQFDGGITASAVVVRGIYAFAATANKAPEIEAVRCMLHAACFFANLSITHTRCLPLIALI